MSENANIAAAKAYFDAWNAHDVAAIVATFASDGIFWDNQMRNPVPVAEARSGFGDFLRAVPDLRFEVARIAATEDSGMVAEWRLHGTGRTGAAFDIPGVDVFDVADGKLRAARAYFNPAPLSA